MNNDPLTPSTQNFLTVDQFALRLQVSRATVFNWMQRGILMQGQHYFRYGRVLRFIWSEELLNSLLTNSAEETPHKTIRTLPRAVKSAKSSPINWEY